MPHSYMNRMNELILTQNAGEQKHGTHIVPVSSRTEPEKVGLGARVPGGSSHTEPEEVRLEVHGLGVCGS